MPRSRAPRSRLGFRRAFLSILALLAACGGGVESRMAEIRQLQNAGQLETSIGALQEVLSLRPDLPEANYRLGLALVQTGRPALALAPLRKAAESSDYRISAGVLLASTQLRTGRFDEAVRAADAVLAIDPERRAAMRIRANARLAGGHLQEALEDFSRLVELFPSDFNVRALHAKVLADLGRLEEAERAYERLKALGEESADLEIRSRACLAPAAFARDVLKDAEKARTLYDDCAALGPTDTTVIDHLASFYDDLGEPERGTALWRDAVAGHPEHPGLRQGLAVRLQTLGREEEAEQVLRSFVERQGSAVAWKLLASFHRTHHEPAKALEAFEKVMELSEGRDSVARFMMADVLVDLGEVERALELADGLEPDAYAQLLRGRIHLVEGRPREALETFDQVLPVWPNSATVRFLAGLAARELGDEGRAVSELQQAVEVGPGETEAALELARIFHERGQHSQAARFAEIAMQSKGGRYQTDPFAIAARSYTALGETDRAREIIAALRERGHVAAAAHELVLLEREVAGPEKAVETAERSGLDLADPANLEVLRQVVEAELAAGRHEAAGARIERALARVPDSPGLRELERRIRSAAKRNGEASADPG